LFVAIELSSQQLDLLARAIEPWQTEFPRLRWVPRENQHVTMKFLGSTYPRLSSWVEERIGEVASAHPPFRTSLTSLGVFPAPGRARVLWAGLDDRRGRMAEIALALEQALSAEYKPEIRAFSPHLTLARSEQPVSLPAGFASTVLEAGPFTVERLVLFRSHIQRPAPRYERLREFALGG
jgi:2''-5'' RNA ligase